jgi:hypothetical protein
MLTLLFIGMLTLAFNLSFVKAIADPMISGIVRDKLGNPIPNVLIVAQDAVTEIDVASATSNTTGTYSMTVPSGTYNLIVTPPPESGFAPTTISNIEVTTDSVIDIVLVPAETVTFSGKLVDRDSNPIPNQRVILSSAAVHEKEDMTDDEGFFSIQVPLDTYSLTLYAGGHALNVPSWFWLGKGINLTQDTFVTFTLQNRYLSGKVVDPYGNPVSNVSIVVEWGSTAFDGFSGSFSSWIKSDSEGRFNLTVFTSTGVSLKATPPLESSLGPVVISGINITEDTSINVTLARLITFSGRLVDRDGIPVPNQRVILSSAAVHEKSVLTDAQGLFSIQVPSDYYSLVLYAGGYAPNVPSWFWLGKGINLTQDTFVTFTLQNRYLSGKVVDPDGNPASNVSIAVEWGSTSFDGFSGSFSSWTKSDSQGNFNVTVFTCPSVNLKATPLPESPFGPVLITNIDVTEDTSVTVTLAPLITFSGNVVDRDGNPVPNQRVILSSSAVHEKSVLTDAQGLFSIQVPPDYYSLTLYAGGYAANVPSWFWLGKGINLTQDTFVTFTLQNRYLSGKVVDPYGNPVSNVSIVVEWGSTAFDGFSGSFSSWTKSDSQGNFNVTVFTCPSVNLKATPPEGSRFGAVFITGINVTEDKTVIIALVYKPGLPPIADFNWTPTTPKVGELVNFNASASTPNGGEIVSYKWDFGDGHYASGKIVTHTYTGLGTYTVTLNVTDSEGLWDIEQKQIQVEALPTPPLSVSISPLSASILVGQSVTFTSTVSGGYTPYAYQWYLNGDPVSGATSASWTFTPTTSGIYYIHLQVTDAKDNTAQSDTARITVAAVPVGGYSIPIQAPATATPLTTYLILTAILTIVFTTVKRKTIRKNKTVA